MIIDELILMANGEIFSDLNYIYHQAIKEKAPYIIRAFDSKDNDQIQKALSKYIDDNKFDPHLKRFIYNFHWSSLTDSILNK